jgi:hypothetical protein
LELRKCTTGGSTKRKGNLSPAFEKANSDGKNIQVPLRKLAANSNKYISPSMFHLNQKLNFFKVQKPVDFYIEKDFLSDDKKH